MVAHSLFLYVDRMPKPLAFLYPDIFFPIPQFTPLHVPRWLCNDQIDAGTRRWAVEGLAYLTFDADVKEEFVEDEAALKALFHLSRVALWVPAVTLGTPFRI